MKRLLLISPLLLLLTGCTSVGEVVCTMVKGDPGVCVKPPVPRTATSRAAATGTGPVAAAMRAEDAGDLPLALKLYTEAAEAGDAKAMTTVGLMHYEGRGTPKDGCAAHDWFQRAGRAGDFDAMGNLGVMFRDGNCVRQNRKVAFLTFLMIHMQGLGSESTQLRNNQNLRREYTELPEKDIQEALCYTPLYYLALMRSHGEATEIKPEMLPSPTLRSFRYASWWSKEERARMTFTCPAPWAPAVAAAP